MVIAAFLPRLDWLVNTHWLCFPPMLEECAWVLLMCGEDGMERKYSFASVYCVLSTVCYPGELFEMHNNPKEKELPHLCD